MEPVASTSTDSLEAKANLIVAQLKLLVDSHVDHSVVVEAAVTKFSELDTCDLPLGSVRYSELLSPLGESLRSSICRQLEVEGYFNRQTWFERVKQAEHWPEVGDRLGSFTLLDEIGRGARSRVFLCRQAGVGDRQVVVKFTHGSPMEADVLGRLRHPNIVPVYFATEDGGGLSSICMPFLGRSTLCDYFDEAPVTGETPAQTLLRAAGSRRRPTDSTSAEQTSPVMPTCYSRYEVVAWIAWRLTLALAHAHEQGIVHGDVKPSNVLIAWDGNPLLMDFNLSGSRFHAVEAKGGTLPYMPPEQLQSFAGESQDAVYNQRSDLFSLGTLLYEALAGRLPFPIDGAGSSREAYAKQLLASVRRGATPLRSLDRSIPSELAAAVEQCLAINPNDRIATARLLSELIGAEFTLRRKMVRWSRHHRRKLAAAGAVFAATAGVAAALIANRPPLHERWLHEGLELFGAGKYVDSSIALSNSVNLNPESDEARFAYARALLHASDLARAYDQFNAVRDREKQPRGTAYAGYCLSLKGDMDSAIALYRSFLEHSDASPEVHNNLAVALELGHGGLGALEELLIAKTHLLTARERMPDSPAVKYNWLRLQLKFAEDFGAPITSQTADLAHALAEECPDEPLVQAFAAQAFVQRSPQDPARLEDAVVCLKRALNLGYKIRLDAADWTSLRSTPLWEELTAVEQETRHLPKKAPTLKRFIEPTSLLHASSPSQ